MKNKLTNAMLVLLVLATAPVQAGLILDITNQGGVAQFSLSGSDVVKSGNFGTNGVWLDDSTSPNLSSLANTWGSGSSALTSGSGSITKSGTTGSVYDVYFGTTSGCCDFGIRAFSGSVGSGPGDTISWSGVFTTSIQYSWFNVGTYQFDYLDSSTYSSQALLTNGLTINVGQTASVPEPASLALLGLGLLAIGLCRRKQAA